MNERQQIAYVVMKNGLPRSVYVSAAKADDAAAALGGEAVPVDFGEWWSVRWLDTPGVAPEDVPIPQADLRDVRLTLDPGGGARSPAIVIGFSDYGAAGRVFKWLMGMVRLARG